MNRRNFLASVAALPATALFSEVLSQSEQQITHVDTKTGGPLLRRLLLLPVGPINALLLNVDENRDLHAKAPALVSFACPRQSRGHSRTCPRPTFVLLLD